MRHYLAEKWLRTAPVFAAVLILAAGIPEKIGCYASGMQKKTIGNRIFSEFVDNNYRGKESEYGIFYYEAEDAGLADLVLRTVDAYYPLIANDLRYQTDKKAVLIMFHKKETMARVLGVDAEDVPMGAYYGGILNLLSPQQWSAQPTEAGRKDDFLENGPIIHEMIHLVLDEKLKGKYDLWFTEGMALYYENKYTGYQWRQDLDEACAGIRLSELENQFRLLDEAQAYRKSYQIINKIVQCAGESGLLKIMDYMREGDSFGEAYKKVMGSAPDF